ncbi:Protein kinase [Fulvia fulva]|uniref:non-specific serine/threonine protein kinase n=1 Tax=Passalora fulva TaxID=5499 RepID=A0A9Q8P2A2_PASFU|nr:Protein kinase [Fulvia fulva]KAK4634932.1 Protein kinase [Fulvia fulva]KAK4637726.1 Protein kinase [Fulvia fulva]UJO10753.1 Protein kinase [Fulvia fulva]WPV09918.1 Protein kinase [Fulvia fulva]WPV23127.1 Protein kinase [Fulvia fulva]
MSSAAASLPTRTSSHRAPQPQPQPQQYTPHRAASSASRPVAPASPRRSMSTSQPQATASSHSRQPSGNLERLARHDFEQSNVAHPDTSHRRSESREQPANGSHAHPPRSDSMRHQTHGRTASRYNDQPTPAPSSHNPDARSSANPNLRRRTTIDAQTGHWELGKTVGAGSMGKVKLARNKETGEQVAVKIVPRQSTDGEHRTQQERERADHSKEVRTAREAAIVTLVDHPYICFMRDVVRTNYHWYMLFEYVNGGQMLDYIISHGRLKEKQARKFGRQIASALDYCHRNSIVHRDLKIENILISKTGDIKIIDFGLSNLFSPRSHLKTFCGSLYFAAPELLQAKQYTGPEVDVWSFGIVLYVLVCGKVPFDDQSMPQLHAKIKKGVVEYPPWLSPECRSLIARMLNTNPSDRATLQEIMSHPWMTKGFSAPPENHLPARKPLQLPLDPAVVDKMTGFDFGDAETITSQLTKVLESEEYKRAIHLSEKRNFQAPPENDQKRGVFGAFYKRRSSTTSRDTLNTPSTEAIQTGSDPINAYHPLISIYYLAREKQEREAREENPGALALPQSPGEKPLPVPDLAPPAAAHTNTSTYEMAGEKPTGGRTRPRARTHGEDEVTRDLQNTGLNAGASAHTSGTNVHPTIVEPAAEQKSSGHTRKESAAIGLIRRLSRRDRGDRPSHPPPALAAFNNSTDAPRRSFSMRRTRESSQTCEAARHETDGTAPGELLTPPQAADTAGNERRRTHGLGRSVSVNSSDIRRRFTRRGVSEGSSMRPPVTSAGSTDRKVSFDQGSSIKEAASDVESSRPTGSLANRAKSMGHARKESMQVRRSRRQDARSTDVPEETDQELVEETPNKENGGGSPNMKPVYLKGLFSVSTTSNKPLNFIRSDIIRVLHELGVEYREIKGGFSCKHSPSIMSKSAADETAPSGAQALNAPSEAGHRRKISFGGFRDRANGDKEEARATPPGGPRPKASYTQSEEDSEEDPPNSRPGASRSRPAGETSTHVQSDLGGEMMLKFEILVVKVPLLSLHGVQFKKVEGGTWQYKNMAQKILKELRL